jgi:hypothetical protein
MKNWRTFAIIAIFGIVVVLNACDNSSTDPTYDSITISPNTAYIVQGGTQTFIASVDGRNSPNQSVTWTVSGGKAETTINNGILAVANNEADNTVLTIKAISTVASSLYATTTITVHKGSDFFGTWVTEKNGSPIYITTIDAHKLKVTYYTDTNDISTELNNIDWQPHEFSEFVTGPEDYPIVFRIRGMVVSDYGAWSQPDDFGQPPEDSNYYGSQWWALHTNKQKIASLRVQSDNGGWDGIAWEWLKL